MDKNRSEKDKLYQWACECSTKDRTENIFTPINKEINSYWKHIENREYIQEYKPDTVNELKEKFSALWENDEILERMQIICTVACMKNKNQTDLSARTAYETKEKQLKPYIYEF